MTQNTETNKVLGEKATINNHWGLKVFDWVLLLLLLSCLFYIIVKYNNMLNCNFEEACKEQCEICLKINNNLGLQMEEMAKRYQECDLERIKRIGNIINYTNG